MNFRTTIVKTSAALALAAGIAMFPTGSAMASPAGNDYCYGWGPEGPHADQHAGMHYCENAPLDTSQVDDRR